MNLAANLLHTAERYPDRPAVRLDDTVLTYAGLSDASARMVTLLRHLGIDPGDRVAVMLPNVPEFAVVYYGVLRAGAVVVPMNPLLKEREVGYYTEDSGARLIVTWHGCADEARMGAKRAGVPYVVVDAAFGDLTASVSPAPGLTARSGTDTAVILYTSGTTGQPKGAELTHANLSANVEIMATDLVQAGPDDVIFGGLPLFHSFGQTCGLNTAVSVGACLTLVARFTPDKVLDVLERDRVTIFEGVPTMYVALLGAPDRAGYDLSALRVCVSGGAALPVEVMRGFEEAFGCVILEGYGLSETSPVASFNHPGRERKAGSIGTPIRGVEMRVVDRSGADVAPGGGDRRGDPGRLVPQRGPGPGRRRRLLLHRRPSQGPDHPGRVQRVPARDRGGHLRAPGGRRSRRDRRPGLRARRGGRRRRGAQARQRGHPAGHPGVREGPGRRVQVPEAGVVRGRAAQGPDRQAAQARDPATGR
jgi:long-chain acyl-CoA synthetase